MMNYPPQSWFMLLVVMKTNETINGHTGWYRVVASSFASKSQAVQSKNTLRDTYPGAMDLG